MAIKPKLIFLGDMLPENSEEEEEHCYARLRANTMNRWNILIFNIKFKFQMGYWRKSSKDIRFLGSFLSSLFISYFDFYDILMF